MLIPDNSTFLTGQLYNMSGWPYFFQTLDCEVTKIGSGNWIIDNLNSSLATWNSKLAEIWTLLSTRPENFKGGGVWSLILNINDGLKAIGYALLVLFFVMGVIKTCGSFADVNHS